MSGQHYQHGLKIQLRLNAKWWEVTALKEQTISFKQSHESSSIHSAQQTSNLQGEAAIQIERQVNLGK